jgi:DmsE family decaheme c-type cytochrome
MMDRKWSLILGGCALAVGLAIAISPLAAGQMADDQMAGEPTAAEPMADAQMAMGADEEPLDSSICAGCHEDRVAAFASNPHSLLDDPAWGKYGIEDGSCVSCHAGAEHHVEEGGGEGTIFAFREDLTTPAARSQACLSCHNDTHPRYNSSEHSQAGIACTSCHQIHHDGEVPPVALLKSGPTLTADPSDAAGAKSQVCTTCHGDVFTRFEYNEHHRLREGILDCTSCHNPHERATRARLGGFKQETCLACHADKGGPFIYEHGSNRVEGCVACHDPHGSPNRHMLNFQRVAELCLSCHAEVPGFHSRFTLETNCTNCHSSIHGSNFQPFFLQ